jgi:hypothetical protein
LIAEFSGLSAQTLEGSLLFSPEWGLGSPAAVFLGTFVRSQSGNQP